MHNPGEMNSERHYFALIGDIIDSRHEQDRYDVQKKLQSILSSVNAEHAAHIAADFLITLGDEFQGLMFAEKGADPIFVADRIIDEMFPVRIRIAIGFGGMATQIRREAAIGADGEAFYRARHGMNLLRKAENRGRAYSRILLDAGGTECSDCDRNARRKELETGVNTVAAPVRIAAGENKTAERGGSDVCSKCGHKRCTNPNRACKAARNNTEHVQYQSFRFKRKGVCRRPDRCGSFAFGTENRR